jgi:hypothetical protein
MRVFKRSIHLYSALALSATLLVAGCLDLKVPPRPAADGGAGKGGTGGAGGSAKDGASENGGGGESDAGESSGSGFRNGDPCESWTDCESKNCVDSVCCENKCDGVCETCNGDINDDNNLTTEEFLLIGKCKPYDQGVDIANECSDLDVCNAACDGNGACRVRQGVGEAESCLDNGEDCSGTGENEQCAGGTCFKGLCGDPCTCTDKNECCNGCYPINEGGSCDADSLDCTDDLCRAGACAHEFKSGFCLIEGVCYSDDRDKPNNQCQYCHVSEDTGKWSNRTSKTSCNDGVYCNGADKCDGSGNCLNHGGDPCSNGDSCNNTCNETAKNCFSPDTTQCDYNDDPNLMTVDFCNGSGECTEGQNYCTQHKCWKVPPTGQTNCYDNSGQLSSCPGDVGTDACATTDFCGQDAQYPHNSRTFTESTANGDVIVTDSLTGLMWQKTYVTGSWQYALDYCEGLDYAGQTDWRLPDVNELASLVNEGKVGPASDFPGIPSDWFWSSSFCVGNTGYAWGVDFPDGGDEDSKTSYENNVRCIRGVTYFETSDVRFYATGQHTVLDRATGLVWQKECVTSKTWQGALTYCEELDLGGYGDWRLPNINELRSLVNYAKVSPASDFPGIPTDYFFWSSSSYVDNASSAWYVGFNIGNVSHDNRTNTYDVRCVRGGP